MRFDNIVNLSKHQQKKLVKEKEQKVIRTFKRKSLFTELPEIFESADYFVTSAVK